MTATLGLPDAGVGGIVAYSHEVAGGMHMGYVRAMLSGVVLGTLFFLIQQLLFAPSPNQLLALFELTVVGAALSCAILFIRKLQIQRAYERNERDRQHWLVRN